jgi:hypothetical protein
MIHDVDNAMSRLLATELARIPRCPVRDPEQITFDSPLIAEQAQDGEARVNLYLYDVRENRERREEGFRRKPMNQQEQTVGVQRPPVQMDLLYLVTAHAGDDPPTEHRLLANVLGVLLRYDSVPAVHLAGDLTGQSDNSVSMAVAQPDHLADPASLWQALGGKIRPALTLLVTFPFDAHATIWTKVAREAVLALVRGAGEQEPGRPMGLSRVQASVAGIVVDQESGQPLLGVAVSAAGWEEEVTTDEQGFFCLLNLPPGPYTLHIVRRGWRALEYPVNVGPSGRLDQIEPTVIAMRRQDDEERAAAEAERGDAARNVPALMEAGRISRVSLTGTLRLPDGRPAAFIPVRIGAQRTATDAEGVYCFFDLLSGDQTVIAELPGYGDVEVRPEEPQSEPPQTGRGKRVPASAPARQPSSLQLPLDKVHAS